MWPPVGEVREYEGLDNLQVQPGNFRLLQNGMSFDGYLNDLGTDILYVTQHGAVQREMELPVFARWQFTSVLKASVLCLADPTLHFSPDLTLGWYIGNRECDACEVNAAIVSKIAAKLGVPPHRTIFFSGSGGGFASLRTAAFLDTSRVIAVNPQTDISRYYAGHIRRLCKSLGITTLNRAPNDMQQRFSLFSENFQCAYRQRDMRILLCQNKVDEFHAENHFAPLVEMLGGDVAGGMSRDGRLKTVLYTAASGHGPEPLPVTKMLLNDAQNWLSTV